MTMPRAYFEAQSCPEVRAPAWATFIDVPDTDRLDAGVGCSWFDVINACLLVAAGLAGVYIGVAWIAEKALSATALAS